MPKADLVVQCPDESGFILPAKGVTGLPTTTTPVDPKLNSKRRISTKNSRLASVDTSNKENQPEVPVKPDAVQKTYPGFSRILILPKDSEKFRKVLATKRKNVVTFNPQVQQFQALNDAGDSSDSDDTTTSGFILPPSKRAALSNAHQRQAQKPTVSPDSVHTTDSPGLTHGHNILKKMGSTLGQVVQDSPEDRLCNDQETPSRLRVEPGYRSYRKCRMDFIKENMKKIKDNNSDEDLMSELSEKIQQQQQQETQHHQQQQHKQQQQQQPREQQQQQQQQQSQVQTSTIESLQKELRQVKARNAKLEKVLDVFEQIKGDIESLQNLNASQAEESSQKISSLQAELDAAMNKNHELQAALDDTTNKLNSESTNSSTSVNVDLSPQVKKLKETLQSLLNKNLDLQAQLSTRQPSHDTGNQSMLDIENLEDKVKELTENKKELISKIDSLEKQVLQQENDLAYLERRNQDQENEIAGLGDLVAENVKLDMDLKAASAKVEELNEKIVEQNDTIQNLNTELQKLQKDSQKVQVKNQDKIIQLKSDFKELKSSFKQKENEISNWKEKFEMSQTENLRLRNNLEELSEIKSKFEAGIRDLESTKSLNYDLSKELMAKKALVSQLMVTEQRLQQEVQKLEQEVDENRSGISCFKTHAEYFSKIRETLEAMLTKDRTFCKMLNVTNEARIQSMTDMEVVELTTFVLSDFVDCKQHLTTELENSMNLIKEHQQLKEHLNELSKKFSLFST